MIIPIFLDIVSIIGVLLTGTDFNLAKVTRTDPTFSFSRPAYSSFIGGHLKATHDIYAHEHIVFLTYYLLRYVFYAQYVQVAKKYVPLAT